MKAIRVLMPVMFAVGAELTAQEQPYLLTLDQAVEYALQHNRTVLNSRDQIASSKEKVKETRSQGLPQINGTIDFMTYFNYELKFEFGGTGGETDIDYSVLDAGDLEVLSALGSMFGSSEPIIMDNQMSGQVQLSQLLFSGQYLAGVQTAKIALRLADQSAIFTELEVKENITNSYYVTLLTEETLRVIKENLNNINIIIELTNNMYKAGLMEATDVDQLRITASQLTNNQKSLERSIQLNYNLLKFQLGIPPEAEIRLADDLDKIINDINPEAVLLTDYDITDNISFKMMETQVMLSKKQLDIENWAYSPMVSGFYSYTKKIITTGFDMQPNHLAGFNVSVPIFSSGMRRSRVAQARIGLNIAERDKEKMREQLETQKNQLLFNYQSALENFNTQKENVAVAGRVLASIQNKFREGMVSSLDMTQANSNYLNAENNYLTSILTLLQAQTALEKLFNTI
jgi:outer membrane protein TolC